MRLRIINIGLYVILIIAGIGCKSNKPIEGSYRSNFASLGMFSTMVKLISENKFEYRFRGDMMFDTAWGNYTLYDNQVFLLFHPEPKESLAAQLTHDNSKMPLKHYFNSDTIIHYHKKYYIGRNKLWVAHMETGKKVKKANRYNDVKRFVLFGSHYYNRRWYLERI